MESRVTLLFDLEATAALSDDEKRRLRERLPTRISKAGVLRVVSQKHRTQEANRREAIARFAELVSAALARRRPRKPTRVSGAARHRRVEEKRRRGRLKRERRDVGPDD